MNDSTTLGVARQWARDRAAKGVLCPVCTQRVKVYRRPLNSGMAMSLIRYYKEAMAGRVGFIHWTDVEGETDSGTRAKLAYWELLEEKAQITSEKSHSGFWRITEKGRFFVEGSITVPKRVVLYNKKLIKFEGDPVGIEGALGKKFNYAELMGAS